MWQFGEHCDRWSAALRNSACDKGGSGRHDFAQQASTPRAIAVPSHDECQVTFSDSSASTSRIAACAFDDLQVSNGGKLRLESGLLEYPAVTKTTVNPPPDPIRLAVPKTLWLLQRRRCRATESSPALALARPTRNGVGTMSGSRRTASTSRAKAIDLRFKNSVTTARRRLPLARRRGGGASYPKFDLVHINTARVRYRKW
jgi:hypothetical protein